MTQAYSEKENPSDLNVNVWHMCNGINVMVYSFKPGERMMCYSKCRRHTQKKEIGVLLSGVEPKTWKRHGTSKHVFELF